MQTLVVVVVAIVDVEIDVVVVFEADVVVDLVVLFVVVLLEEVVDVDFEGSIRIHK